MSLTWDEIRARCARLRVEDVPALLSDALGKGPDWNIVFRDWVARWEIEGDGRGPLGANVLAFLRDSIEPTVSDPEAVAILATMRRLCIVRPRSGVGMTTAESLGEIRQTIREYGLRRADEMRHRPGGEGTRTIETAADMVERLCSIVAKMAAAIPGAECDCFCGRCRKSRSATPVASFRHRYRVTPVLLELLDDFVNSLGVETRGG